MYPILVAIMKAGRAHGFTDPYILPEQPLIVENKDVLIHPHVHDSQAITVYSHQLLFVEEDIELHNARKNRRFNPTPVRNVEKLGIVALRITASTPSKLVCRGRQ